MSLIFYSPARRPDNEEARQQGVDKLRQRGIAHPAALNETLTAAADLFGCTISAVTVVDGDRQWFAGVVGMEDVEITRATSFCAHTILNPSDVLCVPDTLADPRFAGNPLVTEEMALRFYAGAPLRTSDGAVVGALCVIDTSARDVDQDKLDRLRDLAARASGAL